ncbi:MAG TPA: YbjN domain-containing protein [Alphaproteobacteria bacterium]|nr:YbjN domain-containing protein [Alphaproteobacteria bacterium]
MLNEQSHIDLYDDVSNPLDGIEEIMLNNDWTFNRPNEDELTVHVTGKQGQYKMVFLWQEDFSAMQFCCAPDITIAANKLDEAARVINRINADLWLGHFDIRMQDGDNPVAAAHIPCFRHTSLFRGMNECSGVEHIEDLIDIAIAECERYHMTFELLSTAVSQDNNDIILAMMDVAGQS